MSWKLSRVINNESKRKWKIFYSTGSSDAPALIPPGVGSLTIRRSIGATYQVSASGTCNWTDFDSLKLTVKDGDREMVSSIVPLSQCSNFWTLDLNIVVLATSYSMSGIFNYVRTSGTIFEGCTLGGIYPSSDDIHLGITCELSSPMRCNDFSITKI